MLTLGCETVEEPICLSLMCLHIFSCSSRMKNLFVRMDFGECLSPTFLRIFSSPSIMKNLYTRINFSAL